MSSESGLRKVPLYKTTQTHVIGTQRCPAVKLEARVQIKLPDGQDTLPFMAKIDTGATFTTTHDETLKRRMANLTPIGQKRIKTGGGIVIHDVFQVKGLVFLNNKDDPVETIPSPILLARNSEDLDQFVQQNPRRETPRKVTLIGMDILRGAKCLWRDEEDQYFLQFPPR